MALYPHTDGGRWGRASAFARLLFLFLGLSASDVVWGSGFDFPLGPPNGDGYIAGNGGLAYLEEWLYPAPCGLSRHPGEDWNSDGSGTDYGNDANDAYDPVYSVADGTVVHAAKEKPSWGHVVMIEHDGPFNPLPSEDALDRVWSQYGHLSAISVNPRTGLQWAPGDDIYRGEQLGTVGDYPAGSGGKYHLHFEMRVTRRAAAAFVCGWPLEQVAVEYVEPSRFIAFNRPGCPPNSCCLPRTRGVAVETNCTDGADNDCDAATDCADPDCATDPACSPTTECDNGIKESGEDCDGSDLGGATCVSRGFDCGSLACNSGSCTYNTTACLNDECSPSGSTRCSSSTQQSCGDYDSDTCLEWGGNQACPQGCAGNTCAGDPCTSMDCSYLTNTCNVGVCNNGTCEQQKRADNTSCSDNVFCNGQETCQNGSCVSPGNPCAGVDGDSNCSESCSEASDNCAAADPNGSQCSDGNSCTTSDACSSGTCVGGSTVNCGTPGTPPNGSKTGTDYSCGASVSFLCDACYQRSGSTSRTCQGDGTWSGTQPTCSLVNCGDPGTPVNGTKNGTDYTCGAYVTFACNSGYTRSGDDIRYCESDATWSGTQPTCTLNSPVNRMQNPSFESGTASWSQYSAYPPTAITNSTAASARTGSWYAWFGSGNNFVDYIEQDVVIPSNATQADVEFWYQVNTDETSSSCFDKLVIEIRRPSDNYLYETKGQICNQDLFTYTRNGPFSLLAYKGLTVRIRLVATTDASYPTSWYVDDIALNANGN